MAVSFYPRRNSSGGALREQIIFTCKKGDHLHGRYLNMAEKKARELGAKSYRFWFAMPRKFSVDYQDEEE